MPISVLLGAQWGDEGKGRITDAIAQDADIVARFNGGDNAGHSITIGKTVVKLHMVPSGIFRDRCVNVIGNGVVLNPRNLLKEIAEIRAAGIPVTPERLKISPAAHIILPGHIALDAAREATKGGIGTTQRGIGFAYMDKASRIGIRAGAMADPEQFAERVREHTLAVNQQLEMIYARAPIDADTVAAEYAKAAMELRAHLADTVTLLHDALSANKKILAEGAQATLLDIDHGTYPYVTSSSASIGGVMTGLGVPPQAITRIIGVAKAFATRVGAGPFPTELSGEMATRLRGTGSNPWDEFGSTTGRPRRVGWLDLVALRHVIRINGIQELAITKLDILSGLPQLNVATSYQCDGVGTRAMPQDSETLARCAPIYTTLVGWSDDVQGARSMGELPLACRDYVRKIEAESGAHISLVSVGPEREQLIQTK